jgi:hypothetical protein
MPLPSREAAAPFGQRQSRSLLSAGLPRPDIPRRTHLGTARLAPRMIKPPSPAPFAHTPRCLVRPFRDCPCSSGTGYAVPPSTRRSQSRGALRVPPLRDLSRPFPRPCIAWSGLNSSTANIWGGIGHSAVSHRSGSSTMTTVARLLHTDHPMALPNLRLHLYLKRSSPSPKSLRQFHQINRVNGIKPIDTLIPMRIATRCTWAAFGTPTYSSLA